MKKFYSFLALMLAAVSVHAQSWQGTEPDETQYNHETVVYARLNSNLSEAYPGFEMPIAAFIDGECRGSATLNENQLYIITVRGDLTDDYNKVITFKLYNSATGNEYTLPETVLFDGESHGTPPSDESKNFKFNLNAASYYTLTFAEAEVGHSYELRDYVEAVPEGYAIPDNLTFAITMSDAPGDWSEYVSLKGSTLQGLKPYKTGGFAVSIMSETGEITSSYFMVTLHATSLAIQQPTFKVNKDDQISMKEFMSLGVSYTAEPEGFTDDVLWEKQDDGNILGWNEADTCFIPQAAGTAKIRPYIVLSDQSTIYPNGNAWITVNVVIPVEAVIIDYTIFSEDPTAGGACIPANVGDTHLYERLQRAVTILPENATDRSFSISMDENPAVKLTGTTTLTAQGEGDAVVMVKANGVANPNEPISNSAIIRVQKPTTQVDIAQNTIYVPLTPGQREDITSKVQGNVTFNGTNPVGDVSLTGSSVICDDPSMGENGLTGTYMAVQEGTTTVNIVLRWPNYDAWHVSGTEDALTYNEVQAQFNITVQSYLELSAFNIAVTNPVAGQNGTITLTPQPENATFDPQKIGVTISNGLNGDWGALLTVTKGAQGTDALVFNYTSAIPGAVYVSVEQTGDTGNTPIQIIDATQSTENYVFQVGNPLSLDAGWQWRSNPCGAISADDLENVFSTADLEEIRTSNKLLYNDPQWGFYGTLTSSEGILQEQCYKIKMKNAHESVLYPISAANPRLIAGTINTNDGTFTVSLKPGWNWVGTPYFFDRKLSAVFTGSINSLEGVCIVGKLGSAEVTNGNWDGDLKVLKSGDGYVIKNPNTDPIDLTFPSELLMTPANEVAAGVKSFAARANVWRYDHSRFMNNMTMVAEIEDLSQAEQYSIGAFVGDECRGEGIIENGKAFITVHCNMGEYVTFKLYNAFTGEYRLLEEGLKAQTRVGSVKAPFRFHAGALVDGIQAVSTRSAATETFDLSGRRTSAHQRGVNVRRMADGSLHKVIVK